MNGEDMKAARVKLGEMWGLGRPLKMTEMGRILGLSRTDPGQSVREWERGNRPITGTTATLVQIYLNGALPIGGIGAIRGADEPED